ncbi:hypothetical protein BDV96DRAFT_600671 [Lophiotrema nucula]|uniref:Uncharacterized protein n=1 Tax=Lophiotrema nucula TaxID=690887 RepID=A0A6A5Z492_9PLEO|nr:hypothetical protein BDV96DRAFT_600671 [Lophiotrema nucula]
MNEDAIMVEAPVESSVDGIGGEHLMQKLSTIQESMDTVSSQVTEIRREQLKQLSSRVIVDQIDPAVCANACSADRGLIVPEYERINGGQVKQLKDSLQGAEEMKNLEMTATVNLRQQINDLKDAHTKVRKSHDSLSTLNTSLQNDVAVLKQEIANREKNEIKLRDIILENAANEKITDMEVRQAFLDFRQSVQQLAKSSMFQFDEFVLSREDQKIRFKAEFYHNLPKLSTKDGRQRLQARVFDIIFSWVFGKPCFGLKRQSEERKRDAHLGKLEDWLGEFENHLMQAKVAPSKIADWRIVTLACVAKLELPEEYSVVVASEVENFLRPVLPKGISESECVKLWEKIVTVCKKAVALKLLMQRSKEGFNVESYDIKDLPRLSEATLWLDPFGVEGGKFDDRSDTVAYVLSGALVKHSSHLGGDRKYLEKAEVILKKRDKV